MQEGSEVFVLHVTHASKTYLPQHLSATHIKHEYTTAFIKHKLPQAGAGSHTSGPDNDRVLAKLILGLQSFTPWKGNLGKARAMHSLGWQNI